MTDEILNLMDDYQLRCKTLDQTIGSLIRETKEMWTQEQSDDAERLHQLHDSFNIQRKVKEITGTKRKRALPSIRKTQKRQILDSDQFKPTRITTRTFFK